MLEQRVAHLEDDMKDVKASLKSIEAVLKGIEISLAAVAKQSELQTVRADLAELKGKIFALPTWWMLLVALVATWSTGAAIVATLIRQVRP